MIDAFQLQLPGFEGTAEDLLEDVRRRRVSAETLELSAVTSQILDRLDVVAADLDRTGELAAQLSRLIFLKATALMLEPEDEEELPERIHRERLGGWFETAAIFAAWQGRESFSGPGRLNDVEKRRVPMPSRLLGETLEALSSRTQPMSRLRPPAFASIELTASRLVRRLRRGRVRFSELLHGSDRRAVVIHFLAVLDLIRAGRAAAGQDGLGAEIIIEGTAVGDERAAAV